MQDAFEKAMEDQTESDETTIAEQTGQDEAGTEEVEKAEETEEAASEPVEQQETSEQEEAKEEPPQPNLSDLQHRLADLEREKRGLYSNLKAEREKRQQLDGKMSQVSDLLTKAFGKEQSADEPPQPMKIPVEIDEEGNAFVAPDVLEKFTQDRTKSIQDELKSLKETYESERAQTQRQTAQQQALNAILAEKPDYPERYNELHRGMDFLNRTIQVMQTNGQLKTGNIPTFEKLQLFSDPQAVQMFSQQFPTLDIERTIRAMDSPFDFKRALDSVQMNGGEEVEKTTPEATKLDKIPDTTKKVATKPQNLADMRSQKTVSEKSLDEIVNDLSYEDMIFNLSDSEMKKLRKLVEAD